MKLFDPKLKAFVAVARHKTVHLAAEHLFLTQTAVTQRIKLLEEKLKVSLFIRSRRGMELTEEGHILLRYCHSMQSLEEDILREIKGAGIEIEASLHIAGPTSIMCARIIPALSGLTKKYPRLSLRFSIVDDHQRHLLLKHSECDLAILSPEQIMPEMSHKILAPEQYVLVGPKMWQQRDLKEIVSNEKIIDFLPDDQLSFAYLQKFKLFEVNHPERHFVNHTESLAFMVSQGLGYTVLTTEFMAPFIQRHELVVLNEAQTLENPMLLAWYQRTLPAPYFQDALDLLI
jgi:LysR family transcriptional regulator (chromosome initiation inhibitor)